MRGIALLVATFGLLPHTAVVRAEEPGSTPPPADEPAIARVGAKASPAGFWARRQRGPRLKLGYRTFSVTDLGARHARYHCATADLYIYSGLVRTGLGLEGGTETTQRDNFILGSTINLGAQYPARLTPFVDLILGLGVARRDLYNQDLVGFAYSFGIEAGTELFVYGGLLISAGLGWRRQVLRHGGNDQVEAVYVYYDSLTVKLALGF